MATKFTATMYVAIFQLAKDGCSNLQIAKTLGVTGKTLKHWVRIKPAVADAIKRGRGGREKGNDVTFHEYIYQNLPLKLRKLWDEIEACEKLPNGVERTEALLKNHGKRTRQHLFVHALTSSLFNVSASLRKIGVPRSTFETWKLQDPDFSSLLDEIHWHKKNFFEQAVMGRVAAGDTAAIIHVAKTQLRDRGYNDKVEIVHSGTVDTGSTFDISDLDLPIETRKIVLAALRAKQAKDEKL